jgi:phosphoribosylanthranilate isomerase
MSVLVKICGITSRLDAEAAIEAGADALGFIFFKQSPRYIAPAAAAQIIAKLPTSVLKVGVFVDEPLERLNQIAEECGLNRMQLHGSESCDLCAHVGKPVIKAFRVKDPLSLAPMGDYRVSAFLLDSYVPGQFGGTGAKFNWDLAIQAKSFGTPIVLAGGLVPENVGDAVAKVVPWAVDVSSGVEFSPGVKDHAKVREFIRRAKGLR